jgi:uncharacterized protein YndB with AHSA1/START domain
VNRIEQSPIINAPPGEVWNALTDATLIRKWSGAAALFPFASNAHSILTLHHSAFMMPHENTAR